MAHSIRVLRGALELEFPDQRIEAPRAPTLLGPLILLALHPRQELSIDVFKTQLFDIDPGLVSTSQIQTPISRLRRDGLPIRQRVYLLDVAPEDVDIVDFDTRAAAFIDRAVTIDRLSTDDMVSLQDEAFELHHIWRHDPAAAVGNNARLSRLFEPQRRRNRRFGWVFVRLLLRAGERDRADDILDQFIDRYGDDVPEDVREQLRSPTRPKTAPAVVGPRAAGAALAEVRDRMAATARLDFAELALGAHNLDRIFPVDRLEIQSEALIDDPVEAPGGAAPNTAYALARLGCRVSAAGIVSDDRDGALIRLSLSEAGVDLSPLVTLPAQSRVPTGNSHIYVDPFGKRLTFIQPGANERLAETLQDDRAASGRLHDMLRRCRIVNMSSFSGDAERRLQELLLSELSDEVLVGFDPGSLYGPSGLDRLASLIVRCDVLYAQEDRLRQMVDNSSADVAMQPSLPFRAVLEGLYRWRAARVDRPLVVVVKRPRTTDRRAPETGSAETITLAVGRRSVEDLVSARAPSQSEPPVADTVGDGSAIAAAVHLGLLREAPLDECADLVSVVAHEVASHTGSRAGLLSGSTIADAWSRYYPRTPLPTWVGRA